jgi:hypothetical protein
MCRASVVDHIGQFYVGGTLGTWRNVFARIGHGSCADHYTRTHAQLLAHVLKSTSLATALQ